jgi:hypothetical protein
MSNAILLDCPKCGRKIRISGVAGTVHVTCPACGEQWDWPKRREAKRQGVRKSRWRVELFRVRFSGAQLAAVLVAGIGIGIFAGVQFEINSISRSGAQLENPKLPVIPGTGQHAVADPSLPPGKIRKTDSTNVPDFFDPDDGKAGP